MEIRMYGMTQVTGGVRLVWGNKGETSGVKVVYDGFPSVSLPHWSKYPAVITTGMSDVALLPGGLEIEPN